MVALLIWWYKAPRLLVRWSSLTVTIRLMAMVQVPAQRIHLLVRHFTRFCSLFIDGDPTLTAAASTAHISDFTPELLSECPFSLLLQLDDVSQPGILEEVFNELFSRCRRCSYYMTRRATIFHKCKQNRRDAEVIDLTNEN